MNASTKTSTLTTTMMMTTTLSSKAKAISVNSVAFLISGVCKIKISVLPPSLCAASSSRHHRRRICANSTQFLFIGRLLSLSASSRLYIAAGWCPILSGCEFSVFVCVNYHLKSIRSDVHFAVGVTPLTGLEFDVE